MPCQRFPGPYHGINPRPAGYIPSLLPFHLNHGPGQLKKKKKRDAKVERVSTEHLIMCMGLGDESRLDDGAGGKEEALPISLQTASCPMRQQGLPALISSKAQSKERREREGERDGWTRGGSANLGRSSEAPENIGHWPIFFFIEEKRRFAVCINSSVDSNILHCFLFCSSHHSVCNFFLLTPLWCLSLDASCPTTL